MFIRATNHQLTDEDAIVVAKIILGMATSNERPDAVMSSTVATDSGLYIRLSTFRARAKMTNLYKNSSRFEQNVYLDDLLANMQDCGAIRALGRYETAKLVSAEASKATYIEVIALHKLFGSFSRPMDDALKPVDQPGCLWLAAPLMLAPGYGEWASEDMFKISPSAPSFTGQRSMAAAEAEAEATRKLDIDVAATAQAHLRKKQTAAA